MVSPPLAPSHSATHLVLCDYGALGTAYVETDPEAAGRDAIVRDLIAGEYEKPLRVIAFDTEQGWSRDVSKEITAAVLQAVRDEGKHDLPPGTHAFVAAHIPLA